MTSFRTYWGRVYAWWFLVLCAALCGSFKAQAADEAQPERPNILLCLADDWGWPHAGAYGDDVVKTPTFDRLAGEGVLFEHAFVSSPSCTPSRNALVTGQQFYRLGAGANLHSTLDAGQPNVMFRLREAGYQIGHWRKAWGPGKFKKGGYREHPCGPESDFASFMNDRDSGKPFCFWFGSSDPHRWPAGVPEGSTHPKGSFSDCDHGPTKSVIMNMPETQFYDLCFAKRPAIELYDCVNDPDQVNNLADDPRHEKAVSELRTRLVTYLEKTGDPRLTGQPAQFDEYPSLVYIHAQLLGICKCDCSNASSVEV